MWMLFLLMMSWSSSVAVWSRRATRSKAMSRRCRRVSDRSIETIPQSEELAALLARVHGVHSLADMRLDDSFYHKMAFLSPYVRQRLTFMRTLKFYDFYDEVTTP